MGRLGSRWAILLLVAAVAIPAATVLAQDAATTYKPAPATVCWSCHQQVTGSSGPLKNFVNILPPPEAGAAPNEPFQYVVQLQNGWSAQLRYLEPTLDLTNAPSISFAADVPPVTATLTGAIPVDFSKPNDVQKDQKTEFVPIGETELHITVKPGDPSPAGPVLTLKIYGEGQDPSNGTPAYENTSTGRGQSVGFDAMNRSEVGVVGYGNLTLVVETRLLPTAPGDLNFSVPQQNFPYSIDVSAKASATEDRISSIGLRQPVERGGATSARFGLVATKQPADGEYVTLNVKGYAHYDHKAKVNPCCDNFTQDLGSNLKVQGGGRILILAPADATAIVAPAFQNGATMTTVSEVVGYASAFLLISSIWTGGMFGKASRRQLNTVFGSAKRRVAFHNFLSYGLMAAAAVHVVLFIIETSYYWTVGVIWGGLAILAMLGLGLTGAFQVQMIRKWSYGFWRWSHYGLAVAAIVFTIAHGLLDGAHFTEIQEKVGWKDPLDNRGLLR